MRRILVALSVWLVASMAWAGKRDVLVKEFLAYLAAQNLPHEVVEQTDDTLVLAVGGAKTTIAVDNLEKHIAAEVADGASEAEVRSAIFQKYAATLREMAKPRRLSLKADGAYLLPRLVSADYLANLKVVLHQPLGTTGLQVTWVRDGEGSVRYLTPSDLNALGLTRLALDAMAKKNLARTTSVEMLRGGLTSLVAVRRGDSFDAARLLLVPDALKPGEAVQAAVPDRDLLILAPVPRDGDWAPSRSAARAAREGSLPDVPGLLDRPLRVTREGFELK